MIGQRVHDAAGRVYDVTRELGAGGQGTAYGLTCATTGTRAMAKVFAPGYLSKHPTTGERVAALVGARLHRRSVALAGAPRERLVGGGEGYVGGLCEGDALIEHLATHAWDIPHAFALATALARVVSITHAIGIAHGDLSAANVLVADQGDGVPRVSLIDFDGAVIPGAPRPPCFGTPLYAAPELLRGVAEPSIATDLFALGTLLHEILLARHPFGSVSIDPEDLQGQADLIQAQGFVNEADDQKHGGVPSLVLGAELRRMLRRALSVDPRDRPAAAEWDATLRAALGQLWQCPDVACGYVVREEPDRAGECPNCHTEVRLTVTAPGVPPVTLRPPSVALGRRAFGADASVDDCHVLLLAVGFRWVARDVSREGTFLERGGQWHRLPHKREIVVNPGDRLRLGAHLVVEVGRPAA